jgi:hypothetical protein
VNPVEEELVRVVCPNTVSEEMVVVASVEVPLAKKREV